METTTKTDTRSPLKIRLNSIAFLVAVLLFLLPFVEIRCNGNTYASNTGIGLAFGTDYKTTSQLKSDNDIFGTDKLSVSEKQSGKMYAAALIALLLGVAGFALSMTGSATGKLVAITGVLAALSLIVLMIQIKYDIRDKSSREISDSFTANLKVTANFTAAYFLSLISFLVAAFLSYRRKVVVVSG